MTVLNCAEHSRLEVKLQDTTLRPFEPIDLVNTCNDYEEATEISI